ncbi:vacuolar calcium ion transporter [Plectosphaerella plurivora]|uniref:Vacuolar calcium ion transporter n=1 Tax=Plectosphaerella plurivora TaxID=936078 RepID=A0A9P9ADA7_9PEZI|nr:vacuolar calcium ion transporter [Plectosphaerella plurivora]
MESARPGPPNVAPLAAGATPHHARSSSDEEAAEEAFGAIGAVPRQGPLRVWPMTDGSSRRAWARLPESDPDTAMPADHEDHGRLRLGKIARFTRWLRSTVSSSWVNGLLIFVPFGLVSYMLHFNPFLTFVLNGIAIIPLSALLTDATEKISNDAGDTVGALLNISLGNLVELIILVALINNQIRIVLASILGSILVNLLLILGSALLASSMSDSEPTYNTAETQLLSSLLFVSVFVFLMPTAFDYTYDHSGADGAILQMTRMSAILVLLIYILYFVHELRGGPTGRHSPPTEMFDVESYQLGQTEPYEGGRSRSSSISTIVASRTVRFADQNLRHVNGAPAGKPHEHIELDSMNGTPAEAHGTAPHAAAHIAAAAAAAAARTTAPRSSSTGRPRRHSRSTSTVSVSSLPSSRGRNSHDFTTADTERPHSRSGGPPLQILLDGRHELDSLRRASAHRSRGDRAFSIMILIGTSIVMSMCAEFLVSTIDYVTHQGHLSEALIGLIILPIVGNIAEYVTVVTVAAKDKLDLAIAVAVGSAIQIALCVTPLTILAAWLLDRKLALTFNVFEMSTLLGTVLMVNLLILSDGSKALRANGLKGALMCACYAIISLGAFLSPPPKEQ